MDVTGVGSVSGAAAIEPTSALSSSFLSPEDLFAATDEQLMTLAANGNTQAILELEKRDAARGKKLPSSADQNQTASATTLDAPAILGLEKPAAAQAAKLLADAGQTVYAAGEEAVGNIVDKFV